MLESLFNKETPAQVFSCEICESSKNTFFIENLQWLLLKTQVFSCEICESSKDTFFTENLRWLLLKTYYKITPNIVIQTPCIQANIKILNIKS